MKEGSWKKVIAEMIDYLCTDLLHQLLIAIAKCVELQKEDFQMLHFETNDVLPTILEQMDSQRVEGSVGVLHADLCIVLL